MTAPGAGSSQLTELLARLRADWVPVSWEWDSRFECALSTLGRAEEAAAQAILKAALSVVTAPDNLRAAPPGVRALCEQTGGLRAAQRVFSTSLPDGTLAYCLWWPWGSGSNFSARIGAVPPAGHDPVSGLVRAAFGLR